MGKEEIKLLKATQLFKNNEKFYIDKSITLPDYIGVMHRHDFVEIMYVISGECRHVEFSSETHAKKGDLFIINYGVPHANYPIENSTTNEPFCAFDCAFMPSFLDNALINETDFLEIKSSFLLKNTLLSDNAPSFPKLYLMGKNFYEIEELLTKMLTEYTKKDTGYIDILRAYLVELIIIVFRQINSLNFTSEETKQEYYISVATKYIGEHFKEKINLGDIARLSFLSESYFSKLFKKVTGSCLSDYLQNLRIKESCELLSKTEKPISEIALEVGFSDIKFFYTSFKKRLKKTPLEYRNDCKKDE